MRLARGLRPRVAMKETLPCGDGSSAWKGALETLAQSLLNRAPWRGGDATVVLSNHFVRYQLLPWSEAIGSDEEWLAYARQRFGQVHGEAAKEWVVRVDAPRRGQPTLACAMDRALLDGLEAGFAAAKSRLVSVQPHLASAFNRLRGAFGTQPAWFVLVEEGRLLLLLARDGAWQSVATRKTAADSWAAELPLLLDRECRLKGIEPAPQRVCLHAVGVRKIALPATGPWRFEWLRPNLAPGLSTESDAPYAMALA